MSFSRKVKQELEAVTEETAIHCKMAQLAAMIACAGEPNVDVLRITSDNNIVIDVIAKLLKELFDIEVINKSPMMIPEDDFIRIGEGLRMTADIQDVYLTLIKSSCCKKAFLRGAFLCNGSVNTPEGAYHFEISSVSEKFAGVIKDIIFVFGIDAKSKVSITASDISTNVLRTAKNGVYTEDKIAKLPKTWVQNYMKKVDDKSYEINNNIKSLVDFKYFNLNQSIGWEFRKYDVIFCRNVMIYFDNPTKQKLCKRLHDSLKPGGYLIIGLSENLSNLETGFERVRPSVYRKK